YFLSGHLSGLTEKRRKPSLNDDEKTVALISRRQIPEFYIMFRKFLQRILRKPVTRLADKFSSAPVKKDVFESLDIVLHCIRKGDKNSGIIVPVDMTTGRIIIFSDQHKGTRDAADDFMIAEKNCLAALDYYYNNNYQFVSLGDCEELWENTP